jgi:hypothetical protein
VSARSATVVTFVALLITACGSSENSSSPTAISGGASSTPASLTTPPPAVTSTTTMPIQTSTMPTPADVQQVEFAELDNLLPDLSVVTLSASHVVELQNRTLTVSVEGSTLCVGGGDFGLQPDTCGDLTAGLGVLTYSDNAETRVYAVLTSDTVSVSFLSSAGDELPCYREPISAIGALALSWCENEFAPLIRFDVAAGTRLEVVVG